MGKRKRVSARGAAAEDYDSSWKEVLDRYFEAFMAFFFAEAHAEIDWARGYEMLDKELQKIVRHAKVGRRSGQAGQGMAQGRRRAAGC